ncbi:MAG TPA: histidine phosphatase family protein [Herpetosiphonaceae bacterium]
MGDTVQASTVFLCRHGHRIEWARPDWCGDGDNKYDPYLSDQGIAQARALGRYLRRESIDHIVVSPFLRAIETAHYIAEQLERRFVIEDGAGEWLNVEWFPEGAPQLPAPGARMQRFPRIDTDYCSWQTPSYPETQEQMQARMGAVIQHLVREHAGSLLIVGHGHTVTEMAAALSGLPSQSFGFEPCCLTRLDRRDGTWHVTMNGETAHYARFQRLAPDQQHTSIERRV